MDESERSTIELNERQIKVLEWIKAGCPDGVYTDANFAHRTSARALHSRGLVKISGHGDSWRAVITERGQIWPIATARDAEIRESRDQAATANKDKEHSLQSVAKKVKPKKTQREPSAATLAARDLIAATELIQKVLEAEEQELLSTDLELGPIKLQRIIAASIGAPNRPFGRRLTSQPVGGYGSKDVKVYFALYFRDFVVARPVELPEKVGRYHPTVKEFIADKQWQYVTKEHVPRAARILQAIATEAVRRGYEVLPHSQKPDERYRTASAVEHGNLWIDTEFGYYGIEIKEVSAPGGKKSRDLDLSWQQIQRLPNWIGRRGWEFISSGRLQLGQGTSLGGYGSNQLSDARGTMLEERLPEVFVRFDTWLLEQAERTRLAKLAKERKQRDWEAAMANAKTEYFIAERWKYFASLVEEDEQFRKYRDFLARAEAVAAGLSTDQRFAARGFLSEIEATMKRRDPLKSPERLMPQIREPKAEELKPYLRGWSPYGAERR